MGYKDIKMEVRKVSPIRICRIETDRPSSYHIPKIIRATNQTVIPSKWLSQHTKTNMEKSMKESKENRQCADCKLSVPNRKVAGRHIPQHYHKTFCPCGHGSRSRDMVLRHQRIHRENHSGGTHGGVAGQLYLVDQTSFAAWRVAMNLPETMCYDEPSTMQLKRGGAVHSTPVSPKKVKMVTSKGESSYTQVACDSDSQHKRGRGQSQVPAVNRPDDKVPKSEPTLVSRHSSRHLLLKPGAEVKLLCSGISEWDNVITLMRRSASQAEELLLSSNRDSGDQGDRIDL
jgi:hypothetical protein